MNPFDLTSPHVDPSALPFSPACERNKGPILERLAPALAGSRRVLEVGSGTGQHAVHFAAAMPALEWQPSDLPEHLPGLRARFAFEAPPNVLAPLALDVRSRPWRTGTVDAIYTANTLHIMSWSDVVAFFGGVADVLAPGGALCVYGPFRYDGAHTSPSNAEFDLLLRERDPASGIREFAAVDALATQAGLAFVADHALPANNRLLHWRRAR
jgi:SAM-dependent methyltransferase